MNAHAPPRLPGKTFTARIAPQGPRLFVLAGIAAAFLMTAGLIWANSVPIVPTLFAIGLLFHYWPAVSGDRDQMRMNTAGLWLDGLGEVPWDEIESARQRDRQAGANRYSLLEIALKQPAAQSVRGGNAFPQWRSFQTRIWRLMDGDTPPQQQQQRLFIALAALEDDPTQIREAFEAFWGRKVITERGILA